MYTVYAVPLSVNTLTMTYHVILAPYSVHVHCRVNSEYPSK